MTGGLASMLASFLTQFMRIPFAGAVIVTGLYMLVAYLAYKVLSRIHESGLMGGLAFLPAVFLFLCMENDYYRFQGHVAFVLMLSALCLYVHICRVKLRYLSGLLMIPVLYHAAGSVAMVFAVSAMLSPLEAEEELASLKPITLPPSSNMAASKLSRVRVEGSKNKVASFL